MSCKNTKNCTNPNCLSKMKEASAVVKEKESCNGQKK